ncbi:MAG TPA: type I-E CRISPR-associated protein Cas5/CasD [Thermomicrobiales bacterium]|jgi:CRISPR system Cascade subunit CasD
MHTLLLRLAGPMQAWGTQSRYLVRDTGFEPSKSGVVGLVCAALGRSRNDAVDDLAALRMGVRVDREGVLKREYHTAGGSHRRGEAYGVVNAKGELGGTVVSQRYYLADADFLVGLSGDDLALLRLVDGRLRAPVWQVFLGRKSFVPGTPVAMAGSGIREGVTLVEALAAEPWPEGATRLRMVLEADAADGDAVRHDQPWGEAFAHRRFLPRYVKTAFLEQATGAATGGVRDV